MLHLQHLKKKKSYAPIVISGLKSDINVGLKLELVTTSAYHIKFIVKLL